MSAGPNSLRTFSEIGGVQKEANLAMSAIGEEVGDDDEEEELKQAMEWRKLRKQEELLSKRTGKFSSENKINTSVIFSVRLREYHLVKKNKARVIIVNASFKDSFY